jgi:hypothetical protein
MPPKQCPEKHTTTIKYDIVARLVCIVVLQVLVTLFSVASSQLSGLVVPTIAGVCLLLVKNYAGEFDSIYHLTRALLFLCVAVHLYMCLQYGWGYSLLGESFLYLMGLVLATGAGLDDTPTSKNMY